MSFLGQNIELVVLGTAALLLPVLAILIFINLYFRRKRRQEAHLKAIKEAHQKAMLEASIETQEVMRRQIGGDLHDDIGTLLSATRLSLAQLGKKVREDQSEEYFQKTQQMLNEAISNVRRISKELMPSTLDEFGLVTALEEFAEKITSSTNVVVSFRLSGDNKRFSKKIELPLYRITQELTNNALKYSKASSVEVLLSNHEEVLRLEIKDDGEGFDYEEVMNQPSRGIGLRNIESRVSVLQGKMQFDVAKGRGSNIWVEVPV
jgi:signal transduction histidine kinase